MKVYISKLFVCFCLCFATILGAQSTKIPWNMHFYDNFDYSDFPVQRDSFESPELKLLLTGVWDFDTWSKHWSSYVHGPIDWKNDELRKAFAPYALSVAHIQGYKPPPIATSLRGALTSNEIDSNEAILIFNWYFDKLMNINYCGSELYYPYGLFPGEYTLNFHLLFYYAIDSDVFKINKRIYNFLKTWVVDAKCYKDCFYIHDSYIKKLVNFSDNYIPKDYRDDDYYGTGILVKLIEFYQLNVDESKAIKLREYYIEHVMNESHVKNLHKSRNCHKLLKHYKETSRYITDEIDSGFQAYFKSISQER